METPPSLHLFKGFGVELEYMIVDRDTFAILPIADRLIHAVAGAYESEIERGKLCWSNELVLHVVELKTNGPATSFIGLSDIFHNHVREINAILKPLGGLLLPTAMHPWMNPDTETRLWPHDYNIVYEMYNKIFNCRGHGWSNLQSVHLNLPFAGEDEFGRLHAAIRVLLPIMPALAASSPIVESRATGIYNNRMHYYRANSSRIPSITGKVIPEPVFQFRDYEREIFQRMYADIAPFDPDGILQHEWLNARGAIARFDRHAIEIRVLDIQECPQADLAILWLITSTLQALCEERWTSTKDQQAWPTESLEPILAETIQLADAAVVRDDRYLNLFGYHEKKSCTAAELWYHLYEKMEQLRPNEVRHFAQPLQIILRHGSLSRRILRRVNGEINKSSLFALLDELSACLAEGRMYLD
ncbi:MAG: glutamate--cysteine ligase [Candidatus Omnitrophota bacterium]|jgi:gamma-glutamyl:cysteine ligase YbdK (ATP-grasp superfamily)|nr:MAG: glutamate--cysteine ligase [Candidatus Omnitrophota bacterium]